MKFVGSVISTYSVLVMERVIIIVHVYVIILVIHLVIVLVINDVIRNRVQVIELGLVFVIL